MIPGHVLKVRWFVTRFPEADQIIHGMGKAGGIRPGHGKGDFTPKTKLFNSCGCHGLRDINSVNFLLRNWDFFNEDVPCHLCRPSASTY